MSILRDIAESPNVRSHFKLHAADGFDKCGAVTPRPSNTMNCQVYSNRCCASIMHGPAILYLSEVVCMATDSAKASIVCKAYLKMARPLLSLCA